MKDGWTVLFGPSAAPALNAHHHCSEAFPIEDFALEDGSLFSTKLSVCTACLTGLQGPSQQTGSSSTIASGRARPLAPDARRSFTFVRI